MQTIEAKISVPVPDGYVLVTESRYKELESNDLSGRYWTLSDVMKRIGRERTWVNDNILFNAKWRKMIDAENGGFVFYPENGGRYAFHAKKTAEFLEQNFSEIFKK